jgi:plastocyanin
MEDLTVSVHAQRRAETHRLPKLSALTMAACVLAVAGCGSSSSNTSSSASTPTATTASTSTAATTTAATAPTKTTSAPSGASAAQTLSLEANHEGQLKYEQSTLTANAGKVSIDMTNMSPLMHNVTVESSSHAILGATPTFNGGSKTVTLELKPGTYKFFCSVPGHRAAGMEGTLTVK